MHPEIARLIAIAKDSGLLTDRQREIILRKAETLGENLEDVEFELDNITISKSVELIQTQSVNNRESQKGESGNNFVYKETSLQTIKRIVAPGGWRHFFIVLTAGAMIMLFMLLFTLFL